MPLFQKKAWQCTMAGSKKVKQIQQATSRIAKSEFDPVSYYSKNPSWYFSHCDMVSWTLDENNSGNLFWSEILPFLKSLEKRTWQEILSKSNNNNHFIMASDLNAVARKRLEDMFIEYDAVVSLRLNGTHRLYGFIVDAVFHVLWFDTDHGDNDKCVCRSRMKHT